MERMFFELIQVSLGTRECFDRIPTAEEWAAMFEESFRQAVTGVMLGGIERLPKEQRPPIDLLLEWIGETQVNEKIVGLHQNRARELTKIFKDAGFRSCVLKGVGTATLYPNPQRRACGDIDLWVSGRRKDVMKWLRTKYDISEVRWHHVDALIFDDVQTEIHFHATWLFNPLRNKRLQLFFEEEKLAQMKERPEGFGYPSAGFNAVYSLVHSFHHLLECGIGFRHVIDYYYIVRKLKTDHGELKIKEATETIKSIGLYKFLGAMMYVLKEACGAAEEMLLCPADEAEGRFLLSEIVAAGNFGHERVGEEMPTNSLVRFRTMVRHYPSEVLWMIPWKVWHWCWRLWH